jgi:hypothetical protein
MPGERKFAMSLSPDPLLVFRVIFLPLVNAAPHSWSTGKKDRFIAFLY